MTHTDINFWDSGESPDHQSRKKRPIMLAILGVCGILMALILLSDPRVTAQIDTAVTAVKSRITSTSGGPFAGNAARNAARNTAGSAPVQIAPAITAPLQIAPLQMTPAHAAPLQFTLTTHVRVRRAGILSDD